MSTRRELRRRAVDRFLDRTDPDDHSSLTVLLDAARPAGASGELPGEQMAVAQFVAGAQHVHVPDQRGVPFMNRVVRKALAAPILTVAVAGTAVAGGGIAVAASQGALHVPFTGHDNRSDRAPEAPTSTNPGLDGVPGSPEASTSSDSLAPAEATPSATPSPSLDGLCTAYQAGALKEGSKSPAFGALVTAAGGAENLTTYCVERIGEPKPRPTHPAKPAHPTKPAKPAKPTQAADPTVPARPDRPEKPAEPTKPEQAATPDKGGKVAPPVR